MCIAVTGTERIINCYSHRMFDDENGYIIPEEFTAKKIIFAVSSEKMSGSEEDPVIEYVYDSPQSRSQKWKNSYGVRRETCEP